ncbi:MAG: CpcT/CpeT family chromophore lyase [Parvularcula sp.]|jgi:hypothetical protein|nr:CpcT/CpeT family chromophore lyase [Parvularcula sp.]
MILPFVLALYLQAPQNDAEAFTRQMAGVWSSAEQSQDEAYDYIVSATTPAFVDENGAAFVVQQNWIYGDKAPSQISVGDRFERQPYFQVIIAARDFGGGEVHVTTHRVAEENRAKVLRWSADPGASFDAAWIGEVACMGRMQKIAEGHWTGATACPNGYKGGVKVDTRSLRTPDTYVNWDRGYDAQGRVIWGPESGGYIFKPVRGPQ